VDDFVEKFSARHQFEDNEDAGARGEHLKGLKSVNTEWEKGLKRESEKQWTILSNSSPPVTNSRTMNMRVREART
jgi:hypothetical protein